MSDEDLDGCLVGGRLEYVYCMKPYGVEWNKNMLGVCCFSWMVEIRSCSSLEKSHTNIFSLFFHYHSLGLLV